MTKTCYRCSKEIDEPVEEHASYVTAEDMKVEEEKTVMVERRHSDYTRAIRDRLIREDSLNPTQANTIIGRNDGNYLRNRGRSHDVSTKALNSNQTMEPSKPEKDPEVVRVDTETKTVVEQKTGLVCADCREDDDEVIW